ncbi:MAG: zinc-dependent alcohol dehydrogenase family protein [Bacteroidia bacterium]
MKTYFLNGIYDLTTQTQPLEQVIIPIPEPKDDEILIKISCCGICHTELDEIEGRTPPPSYPVIPGHQVIGLVEKTGIKANRLKKGERVGVAWIFSACGKCDFCKNGLENLCPEFKATGRDVNGGYAEYMTIKESFAYRIPLIFSDAEAAPLLCAGAIGYRSLRLTGITDGQPLGLAGFGASGHLVLKMARHLFPHSPVIVFARAPEERDFAISLGASWAGNMDAIPPFKAHAIIDTTPVWKTIVKSMSNIAAGGRLVINAIRKESADKASLLDIDYPQHLWMEKEIKSVANITRKDVAEFLILASEIPIKPEVEIYPFEQANQALLDLKNKHIRGAKVLQVN